MTSGFVVVTRLERAVSSINTANDSGRTVGADRHIPVRKGPDGPNHDTPRYWFDNDPFMSHFFNAISSMFPEGERFFIRSVRHYADDLCNPQLREQVRAFVQQEAQHFKEHDNHAALLSAQGFGVLARLNQIAASGLNWTSKHMPRFALASTIATEHITAVFADRVLHRSDLWLQPMVPEMRQLWRWHAIEETEHKAVAYDVYQECLGQGGSSGLWLRRLAMGQVLVAFFVETFVRHSLLLIKDRQCSPRVLRRGLGKLWGRQGLIRSFHPEIWRFFRADFHPWQRNNSKLLEDSLVELRLDGATAA